MIRAGLILLIMMFARLASAACAAPAQTTLGTGQSGEIKMSIGATNIYNKLMYCDGTAWQDLGGSATATACTKNGEVTLAAGELYYCNQTVLWRFDSGAATNGACAKPGEIRWNSTQLEFCNGTNWRVVSSDATIDPVADIVETGMPIEAARGIFTTQITGFTGGTGTFTFDNGGGTCVGGSGARVCTDTGACSPPVASRPGTGTLYVPNGSYIRFGVVLSTLPNTTCSWTAVLGGRTFSYTGTTALVDTTPANIVFTDVAGQTPGTVVMSNIVKVSGHTGVTASISDDTTGGSPEFRVCSDATCSVVDVTWGTASQPLTNPKWIQLRTTMGAGALDLKEVALTVGTYTAYWRSTTSSCPTFGSLVSGGTLTCTCPANALKITGNVYGAGNYKQSLSILCKAAVHAGAVNNATGGTVTVRGTTAGVPAGTCSSFTNTTANGVTSINSGLGNSIYFSGFGTDVCN